MYFYEKVYNIWNATRNQKKKDECCIVPDTA